jgi:AAA15 family ATPase/GTPase
VISIYGANASGKTNVIEAMQDMFWTIYNSNNIYKSGDLCPHKPFALDDESKKMPTIYCAEFVVNGDCYDYCFSYIKTEVLHESLYKRKLSRRSTKKTMIFEREREKDIEYGEAYTRLKNVIFVDENTLLLTMLGKKIENSDYEKIVKRNMLLMAPPRLHEMLLSDPDLAAGFYYKDAEMNEFMQNFIKQYDPTIEKVEIIKKEGATREDTFDVYFKRKGKRISFRNDSAGTQRMFMLYFAIQGTILHRDVLVLDEMDIRLHPLIYREIVRMFNLRHRNTNNAQLIFSTHNTILMNNKEFRRDQIYFTEKDADGSTEAYRLSDIRDEDGDVIRNDLDYGKHYLMGEFGAVPYQE